MFCWDKSICYIYYSYLLHYLLSQQLLKILLWVLGFECIWGGGDSLLYCMWKLRFVWDVVLASSVEVWQQNPILRRTWVFRPVQIFRLLCHLTYFFKMFHCTLWIVFCIKVMWNPPDALNSQNWIVNNRMQFGCCIYTSHFCWQFNCPVKSSFP